VQQAVNLVEKHLEQLSVLYVPELEPRRHIGVESSVKRRELTGVALK
jgi:hypothetical protein